MEPPAIGRDATGTTTKPTLESPATKHTPSAIASAQLVSKPTTPGLSSSPPVTRNLIGRWCFAKQQTNLRRRCYCQRLSDGPYGMSSQQPPTTGSGRREHRLSHGSFVPPNPYTGTAADYHPAICHRLARLT